MGSERRGTVTRYGLGLAAGLWTAVTGLALWTVHVSTRGALADELVADATILPVSFVGYSLIDRFWPRRPGGKAEAGVAQVRSGADVVGSAFRLRGRYVITSPEVVDRALRRGPASGRSPAAPPAGSRVDLLFPAGRGPGDDLQVSARVVTWGDVVVLRTVERLPSRITGLKLARGGFQGVARVVLPGRHRPDTVPVEVRDHRLVDAAALAPGWPGGTGAPVLAGEEADGRVVALLSDGATGAGPEPALVEADDLRAAARGVSRREFVVAGSVLGGALLVGGAGLLTRAVTSPAGPALKVLRGAGWAALFEQPQVRAYLERHGVRVQRPMPDLSGVQSLTSDLSRTDFATVPNKVLADQLARRPGTGFSGSAPRPFCVETMVVLARRPIVGALDSAGVLVQLERDPHQRFDTRAYLALQERRRTWADIGVTGLGDRSGNPVKVATSDPMRGNGGLLFLLLLTDVMRRVAPRARVDELFEPDAQFYDQGPARTIDLLPQLENGQAEMVFIYEHDAIHFLTERPERIRQYVMLPTFPTMTVEQMIVTRDEEFADLFTSPDPEFQEILFRAYRMRVPGKSAAVDDLLRTGLKDAVWSARGKVRPGLVNREVQVSPRTIQELLITVRKYS
jgi:hypothetical protein